MEEPKPIRVMIVDDHLMVRDGLKVFLSIFNDLETVAEAENGEQAVQVCLQTRPDVILMDLLMPEIDGPAAISLIRQSCPLVKIIALTSFLDDDLVQRALQAGATSYLLKDVRPEKLAEAVRTTYRGGSTLDPDVARVLVDKASQPPRPENSLTNREREVLALLVEGKTNKEIADHLMLSLGTARLHVSNILAKLGAKNRTEAAIVAVRHNLVP